MKEGADSPRSLLTLVKYAEDLDVRLLLNSAVCRTWSPSIVMTERKELCILLIRSAYANPNYQAKCRWTGLLVSRWPYGLNVAAGEACL